MFLIRVLFSYFTCKIPQNFSYILLIIFLEVIAAQYFLPVVQSIVHIYIFFNLFQGSRERCIEESGVAKYCDALTLYAQVRPKERQICFSSRSCLIPERENCRKMAKISECPVSWLLNLVGHLESGQSSDFLWKKHK